MFDPNAAATADSGIFGLPHSVEEASLVLIPVPWEVTTSYGAGASLGPSSILEASHQVDLFDLDVLRPYEAGIFMLEESKKIQEANQFSKTKAQRVIAAVNKGEELSPEESIKFKEDLESVNEQSAGLNQYVYQETKRFLDQGKLVGIVGGDHSVPFGAIQAISEKVPSFGILHFDAHSDTRNAYEGFTWSHASIMHNVLEKIPAVKRLVQVGIRDVCEEEIQYTQKDPKRIRTFFDQQLIRSKFKGTPWTKIAEEIVNELPDQVWISFDIDGLDPRFCPHTGTPVPGGLDFQEANHVFELLVKSGRKIIGFDLNEVAPNVANSDDEWDANVGARLLYKLSAWTLASQGKAKLNF